MRLNNLFLFKSQGIKPLTIDTHSIGRLWDKTNTTYTTIYVFRSTEITVVD